MFYNSFRKKNPCCKIAFKSQHIKTLHSRKINSPYLNITAVFTFPSCSAKSNKKSERKVRAAANTRRGRIARALSKGVSHLFYSKLKKTPVAELISGNITRSVNKNILKVISSEVRKNKRIHDDVFKEMYLTQRNVTIHFKRCLGTYSTFKWTPLVYTCTLKYQ